MGGLFISEICYSFNSVNRTQLWTNPSDNPPPCRHLIIVMQIFTAIPSAIQISSETRRICKFQFNFKCKAWAGAPWGGITMREMGGGAMGRGMCVYMGVLQTADLALSISIIGRLLWFSPHPGQWNIVNGLGALCCVPHCFSLQQGSGTVHTAKSIAIPRGQALHWIALHVARCTLHIARCTLQLSMGTPGGT